MASPLPTSASNAESSPGLCLSSQVNALSVEDCAASPEATKVRDLPSPSIRTLLMQSGDHRPLNVRSLLESTGTPFTIARYPRRAALFFQGDACDTRSWSEWNSAFPLENGIRQAHLKPFQTVGYDWYAGH